MKRVAAWLVALALGYGGLCLLVYLRQDTMLYLPRPNDARAVQSLAPFVWRAHNDGVTLEGWLRPARRPQAVPLVLYFGGNAEDVALTAQRSSVDANYLYVNYRGYGATGGRPSEAALKSDALVIYDQAVARERHNGTVVAMGRSLGSGVAVHLAANRNIHAVVLITPYDSMVQVARGHYPWLPVGWLLRHRFESDRIASAIDTPALFLIADRDRIVPAERGLSLARMWGGPAQLARFTHAGHGDIDASPGYATTLGSFLAALGGR